MSKSKYPRIGNKRKYPGKGLCEICKAPKAGRVEVQVDIFRGNDDVLKVCQWCQKAYTSFGLLWKLGYITRIGSWNGTQTK
jgi:hypothetical protein